MLGWVLVFFFLCCFFCVFLFSGTSSHKFTQHIHTHTHKLSQVQRLNPPPHAGRRILHRAEKGGCQRGGAEGRDAPLQSGARRMHHPVEGVRGGRQGERAGRSPCVQPAPACCCGGVGRGAEQRCVGAGAGAGAGRGRTGFFDNVERDAISPGRAPGTSQSTQRAALSETRRPEVKPPPKRQTPAGWRLRSPDHWSGAAGAPEQWKCTLSHLLSRRCHTRVSSDWLERGRPVASTNCVSRM